MKLIDGATSRPHCRRTGVCSVLLTTLQVYDLDEAQYQRIKTGDQVSVHPRGEIEELFQDH